jgi:AcrR family transcriptional regulator
MFKIDPAVNKAHTFARVLASKKVLAQMSASDFTGDIRELQRVWLQGIVQKHGTTITGVAKKAGLTPTTLTRLVNDPEHQHLLSTVSINKISRAFDEPVPNFGAAPTIDAYKAAVFNVVTVLAEEGAFNNPENAVLAAETVLELADWVVANEADKPSEFGSVISFALQRLRRHA